LPANGFASRARGDVQDGSFLSLGQINTTRFLFDDEAEKSFGTKKDPSGSTTSPDVKTYLQMNATDDKFPILVRRDEFPGLVSHSTQIYVRGALVDCVTQLSASSAALDLALSQKPNITAEEPESSGWPSFAPRHRPAQHSLPMNPFPLASGLNSSPANSTAQQQGGQAHDASSGAGTRRRDSKLSDLSFTPITESSAASQSITPPTAMQQQHAAPKLSSSYSTSDIPTIKNPNGINNVSQAQQQLHNHNASLGRIPLHGMNNRHSRELSNTDVNFAGVCGIPFRGTRF